MARPKKGTPAPVADKRTSYVLRGVDRDRLKRLGDVYERRTDMKPSEQDTVRLAIRDACILNNLEQRTDVDPQDRAGDTVPPGCGGGAL